MLSIDVISLGRRVREMSRIPRSAACAARKRKSIDCAFSELRAMVDDGDARKLRVVVVQCRAKRMRLQIK